MSRNPSRLTRFLWLLDDLRQNQDVRIAAALAALSLLIIGGFFAAHKVSQAAAGHSTTSLRTLTLRQKVRVKVHGRIVTRIRTRKVIAQAQTVLQTQTIHTPRGTKIVTKPVIHYHPVFRKKIVKIHGKTHTVLQPVTNTQQLTNTQLVTTTKQMTVPVTQTRQITSTSTQIVPTTIIQTTTVNHATTVVITTTLISTETVTVPTTITTTVSTT
jgi:hypothetical protein